MTLRYAALADTTVRAAYDPPVDPRDLPRADLDVANEAWPPFSFAYLPDQPVWALLLAAVTIGMIGALCVQDRDVMAL
jgi:hypothetical protein